MSSASSSQPTWWEKADRPVQGEDSRAMLWARELEMHYRMGKVTVPALRGVNLEVNRGELVAIIGNSGSGKSTLLHILGGLLSPTSGAVVLAGRRISASTDPERTALRAAEVGFVFQRFNLFPTLTVEENLWLAERVHAGGGSHYRGDARRRKEILGLLGMARKAGHKPSELSGGEQQRVALARAVIHRPSVLLADEPTGNLDSGSAALVLRMLRKLNQERGQTIVMVTHNPQAAACAHRILTMEDGRISAQTSRPSTNPIEGFRPPRGAGARG